MSDAKVIFYDTTGPLDSVDSDAAHGAEKVFYFSCPKYGRPCGPLIIAGRTDLKRDGQNQNSGVAQWDWDGNREKPTFTPSINCKGCWHGYIRNGRCVDCAGQDEPGLG